MEALPGSPGSVDEGRHRLVRLPVGDNRGVTPLARLLADPPDLPVVAALADLSARIAPGRALVLTAPPGSGKTTLAPPLLAERLPGRVLVVQPRRIAARAGARRLAALLGDEIGGLAGFSVRGATRLSGRTRVEFCTPGVLGRRLQADPSLEGVGAVMIDEFHERHLDTDLALGLLLDARAVLREDLHLTIASATLEADRVAELLSGVVPEVDRVDVPGVLHPLEVRYAAPPRGVGSLEAGPRGEVRVPRAFCAHVAARTRAALAATEGDVLVFVPGAREIDEVASGLGGFGPGYLDGEQVEVLPLHGSLSAAEQDRVLVPRSGGPRRIVVATPVAESSLTVPGVRCVVDSGLAREPRLDIARGTSSLVTVSAARARCDQRAGRAARLGPGLAIRCFDEVDWARRPAQALPEILVADLSDAALQAACWSNDGLAGLALLDRPPAAALTAALTSLEGLGALSAGRATDLGRRVARLPLNPGIGCALVATSPRIGAERAARFAALLGEEPRVNDADLAALARSLKARDRALAARVDRGASRLLRLLGDLGDRREPGSEGAASGGGADSAGGAGAAVSRPIRLRDEDALALVVAHARPAWIARARGKGRRYLLADGQGASLPENSPLEGSEWLAVAEVSRAAGADGLIRAAVPIAADDAVEVGAPLLRTIAETSLVGGRIRLARRESLGAIPLGEPLASAPSEEEALSALVDLLGSEGLGILDWTPAARSLRERLSALHAVDPDSWPDMSDEALLAAAPLWLAPELPGLARGRPIAGIDMVRALRSLLEWPVAGRLDELAPVDIEIPTGARRRIDWSSGRPVLALRVQEAFGWLDTPTFADGRLPLVLHLTDPAGRPTAVTSDLRSFWAGPYRDVRAQLRGRYPKHPWPEDPFSEKPTSRAKPRR